MYGHGCMRRNKRFISSFSCIEEKYLKWDRKLKKSPGQKKIVKSNKSISRKIFFTNFHFLQFQKINF